MTTKPKDLKTNETPSTTSVKDCMTAQAEYITPETSIKEAAQKMAELKTGSLPVGNEQKLLGFITDRDIAIRVVAEGLDPETSIEKVMTNKVLYCFENNDLESVAENMKDNEVLRLMVLDNEKNFKGIITHSQIAKAAVESNDNSLVQKVAELACFNKVA